MGGFGGQAGLTRLFNAEIGGQISWLLPAALILLVAGLWLTRRAPRTDRVRAALLLWGGWTVVTALVFSLMEGTFHAYYTVALAPGIAALVAVGGREAWRARDTWTGRGVLAATAAVTAVWAWVLLGRSADVPAVAAVGRARARRRRRGGAAGPGGMASPRGLGRHGGGAARRSGGTGGLRGADGGDRAPGQHPDGGPEHGRRERAGWTDARPVRRRGRSAGRGGRDAAGPLGSRAARGRPAGPAASAWAVRAASRSAPSSPTC